MASGRLTRYGVLLRVRKRQEDVKAQAVAIAHSEHAALRRQRRELDERRKALMKAASVAKGAVFEPVRIESLYQYERHLGRRTDAKDAEIALHAVTVQAVRAELESAMSQKRIMEKLIERAEKTERAEAVRREQRWHDESSVIRFAHGRRRGAERP
jgi:flagellar export protein FliJ